MLDAKAPCRAQVRDRSLPCLLTGLIAWSSGPRGPLRQKPVRRGARWPRSKGSGVRLTLPPASVAAPAPEHGVPEPQPRSQRSKQEGPGGDVQRSRVLLPPGEGPSGWPTHEQHTRSGRQPAKCSSRLSRAPTATRKPQRHRRQGKISRGLHVKWSIFTTEGHCPRTLGNRSFAPQTGGRTNTRKSRDLGAGQPLRTAARPGMFWREEKDTIHAVGESSRTEEKETVARFPALCYTGARLPRSLPFRGAPLDSALQPAARGPRG